MDYKSLVGSHLKLRHLVLVLAIEENGSLVRVAEELYMTQPALSRTLREAEAAVGASLFERTRHGMVPTAAGAACLEHARAVVGHVETLSRRIGELTDPQTGAVSIGAHVTGANLLVPRAVSQLVKERPLIEVRIREAPPATLIHELDSGDLDLLVGRVTDHPSTARLRLVPLYREPFRIVAAPGHPALEKTELADLAAYPWAIPVAGTPLRDALEKAFRSEGLDAPSRQVECGTPAPTRTLVVEAGFLAVLPESMTAGDPALQVHPLRLGGMAQDVGYMITPQRPLTASTRLLTEHLQAEANRINRDLTDRDT